MVAKGGLSYYRAYLYHAGDNGLLERGFYAAYDLPKLLSNDVATANKAISHDLIIP
ncbi:hypothetical protein D3C71_2157030 [compost metagenome]